MESNKQKDTVSGSNIGVNGEKKTSIAVYKNTRRMLLAEGIMGESFDDVIQRVLIEVKELRSDKHSKGKRRTS